MAGLLPNEIKRLIFDHADLHTAKTLRLVSSSFALVGIEILFLPTFVIKSYTTDIQRLIDIGSSPRIALQAAKTIEALEFVDHEYDPAMARKILCSRHVQVSNYPSVDFVPNQLELVSLDEIDALVAARKLDDEYISSRPEDFLVQAFRNTPKVHTIKFTYPNPFKQPLSKKIWAEYDFLMYQYRNPSSKCLELSSILPALSNSNPKSAIKHFIHNRFNIATFTSSSNSPSTTAFSLSTHLTHLTSLNLAIFAPFPTMNPPEIDESSISTAVQSLLLANTPNLQHLRLSFESMGRSQINFLPSLPPGSAGKLKSLSLTAFTIHPSGLLSFLSSNSSTLKRINISHADMLDIDCTWKGFLCDIKSIPNLSLEKFQISGMVRSKSESWLLWPLYDEDWMEYENLALASFRGMEASNERTREAESFVLGRGKWPWSLDGSDDLDLPRLT